jgi:hypothetical protein
MVAFQLRQTQQSRDLNYSPPTSGLITPPHPISLSHFNIIHPPTHFVSKVRFIFPIKFLQCHLGNPGADGRIILRWIYRNWVVRVWTGLICLRIGTGDKHLWMRQWTFCFHKMRGVSWLAESRLASQISKKANNVILDNEDPYYP